MAIWAPLLFGYFLGAVTFVPLAILTVLAHGYLTFPRRKDADTQEQPGLESENIVQPHDDELSDLKAALVKEQLKDTKGSVYSAHDLGVASGYFAVSREYTPMGINATPIERSTPIGSTTVAVPSQSIYQSMYRTIFDRKQSPGSLEYWNKATRRPKNAGDVFYVVLRHGNLMLFDDEEQLEIRHIISLANHDISIYSGEDKTPEGELYIKKNALCLSSRNTKHADMAADAQPSKPFYLFSENSSAKEDFYFAMLKNQEQTFGAGLGTPRPQSYDLKHVLSLLRGLHASNEQQQTSWLNGLLGRIFLGLYRTKDFESFIKAKLTKKISRIKRPSFLSSVSIQKIATGDSAPFFTNLRLRDLTVEGECCVEADVKYTGNFRIEVAATAPIDLGPPFVARDVDLRLAIVLKQLEGRVLFKIKAPPSNRIWFTFQKMPKIDLAVEPIIISRQITYSIILRQIESRIKEVVAESLVLPFWDDIPFFNTEHKQWRGGIFEGDDAVATDAAAEQDSGLPAIIIG